MCIRAQRACRRVWALPSHRQVGAAVRLQGQPQQRQSILQITTKSQAATRDYEMTNDNSFLTMGADRMLCLASVLSASPIVELCSSSTIF